MNYIEHHGINKQKWGIRRFQYENGRYTPAGKERKKKNLSSNAKRFDTDRYSHDDGTLTYMGNQKFAKSEKFDEMRKKRRSKKNVGGHGISLVTASVSNSGHQKTDSTISQIGDSSMKNESVLDLTTSGMNAVSALFGGSSIA